MHSLDQSTAERKAAMRPWRRAYRVTPVVLAVGVLLFASGFFWFVRQIPLAENAPARNADGIVVLTGGAFRINDALELLSTGYGRRLLITGVNRTTRAYELSRLMPEHRRWFTCCVDLDYSAINTIGNAVETRRWVEARRFKSLIVVTANFHIPRAMAELEHEIPDAALVPHAVVSDRVKVESWPENPATARLLFLEYLKYIVARVRMILPLSVA
jgi:uncharacterized SAM-binding protein YcdF (DUF218 family)